MSVLTNIKYQYNLRMMQDYISSEDYSEFFNQLEKHKDNKELYFKLLNSLGPMTIAKLKDDLFRSKIIWLNTFNPDDTSYLEKFLVYYSNKLERNMPKISKYEENIVSVLNFQNDIVNLTFEDFVQKSYLYQYLILHEDSKPIKYLTNQLPFFSTPDNFNFTKNTLTKSYLFILDHPYNIYQKIKKNNNNDVSIARNIFLNLDNYSSSKVVSNIKIEMNNQGWHTHTKSWTDQNVINSLNGKIILKKDLIENTFDCLSSIILHFVQSGVGIDLDYKIIETFVNKNPPGKFEFKNDISQKERKFINKYIDDILSSYNFDR